MSTVTRDVSKSDKDSVAWRVTHFVYALLALVVIYGGVALAAICVYDTFFRPTEYACTRPHDPYAASVQTYQYPDVDRYSPRPPRHESQRAIGFEVWSLSDNNVTRTYFDYPTIVLHEASCTSGGRISRGRGCLVWRDARHGRSVLWVEAGQFVTFFR